MKLTKNKYIYCLLFVTFCLFSSCDTPPVFEQNVNLPDNKWPKDGLAHIIVPVTDSTRFYSIILNIRNSDDYPYRNIHLFVSATAPNGATACDTVQYELADNQGSWLGREGNYWNDHRLLYRSSVMFANTGEYQFSIQHGMRADTLVGIGAVGLRIEPFGTE
jgi:gliding motility-associated lipoprotein GldH